MAFERHFSDEAIRKLQQEPLFRDFLHEDIIENEAVFPAVRNNRIDFYHRGGNLFSYNGKVFRTNRKYASVLAYPKDYITEADLEHELVRVTGDPLVPRGNCALCSTN